METSAKMAEYHRSGSSGTLKLSGVVDIFEAGTLLEMAKKCILDEKAKTILVNMQNVERLDISAVQILFTLKQVCVQKSKSCEFSMLTKQISSGLDQIGITLQS